MYFHDYAEIYGGEHSGKYTKGGDLYVMQDGKLCPFNAKVEGFVDADTTAPDDVSEDTVVKPAVAVKRKYTKGKKANTQAAFERATQQG